MVSIITTNTQIAYFHKPISNLNYPLIPSLIFVYNPQKWPRNYKKAAILNRSLGFIDVRKFERNLNSSFCCWCKEGEGDAVLEGEIMAFMAKSEKPTMFPTKEELMRGGRMDLVKAIKERGGWYSLGWADESVGDNVEEAMEFDDIGEFQRRVESCKESASLRGTYDSSLSLLEKDDSLNFYSGNSNSSRLNNSASMDRSLDIGADEDTGIEGILSRLEKQRNIELGIKLGKKGYEDHRASKDDGDDRPFDSSLDVDRTSLGENSTLAPRFNSKGISNNSSDKISSSVEPESWRDWSNQRAGLPYAEFEAAEIFFSKNVVESDKETYNDGISVTSEEYTEALDTHEVINHNELQTHLKHLEFELNTALRSLRSKRDMCISEEVIGNSSDLQKLSDAYEFQENEFMSAQGRLRSIRANMAVLEGKMALAIIDAQKIVEEKQKRIDGARKAIQLLRTTCIVWPNSASEVLLTGSFDGWSTQRKMEKSKTGIFSICLKLYPGRYEIKFIVDGIWKIDPLRPIVNNDGYENNLLIVT